MENEKFFIRYNSFLRELKKLKRERGWKEDMLCGELFSWEELETGRLSKKAGESGTPGERFGVGGAGMCRRFTVLMELRAAGDGGMTFFCVPVWLDHEGYLVHGGGCQAFPWLSGSGKESMEERLEEQLREKRDSLTENRGWKRFFEVCMEIYAGLGGRKGGRLLCALSDTEQSEQEILYGRMIETLSAGRLYQDMADRIGGIYRGKPKGAALSDQIELLDGNPGERGKKLKRQFMEHYIRFVRMNKRAPAIGIVGRRRRDVLDTLSALWEEIKRFSMDESSFLMGERIHRLGEESGSADRSEERGRLLRRSSEVFRVEIGDMRECAGSWYQRFRRSETEYKKFSIHKERVIRLMDGTVFETRKNLSDRIGRMEAVMEKLGKELSRRNEEIDRYVARKNEWEVFLDSFSAVYYQWGLMKKKSERRIEEFAVCMDHEILGGKPEREKILEGYSGYIKERLTEFREVNQTFNAQKQKRDLELRKLKQLEQGMKEMEEILDKCFGSKAGWNTELACKKDRAQLEEYLSDMLQRLRHKTFWAAFHYCECLCLSEQGQGKSLSGVGVYDLDELVGYHNHVASMFDFFDLLIMDRAEEIPVENGILLSNFGSRLLLTRGEGEKRQRAPSCIWSMLMELCGIRGDKKREDFSGDTMWDIAEAVCTR